MAPTVAPTAPPATPEALPMELARALGDPLRWRIMELLATEQLCVAHLAEELDTAQPLVSHHLKVLRQAGLIEPDRYRYWTYYRLRPAALVRLAATLGLIARSAPSGTACRRRIPGVDPVRSTPARPPAKEALPCRTASSTRPAAPPSPARSRPWPRSSVASTRWRPSSGSWTSPSTAWPVLGWSTSSPCSCT